MTFNRRQLLSIGAVGALSACTPASVNSPDTPTSSARPPSAPTKPDWDLLARHVKGTLARPGSSTYDAVRLVQNPRYDDNRPRGVLTVASDRDVATAISFAHDHAVPIVVRSGGHSYPGYSAGGAPGTGFPPSLVIDCRSMSQVSVDGANATIGAGAALAQVYNDLGSAGRGIAGGSCPTVGIAGLAQGGGVGVLVRAHGLTCDAVTAMNVVTADGKSRKVSADDDADLYWALRGGGGGNVGVVTSFTTNTFAAPTVHTFYLTWQLGSAAQVVEAWTDWAPSADPQLWSTMKLLGGATHPSGPTVLISGTWLGPAAELDTQLTGLLDNVPAPATKSTSTKGYLDAMVAYAGCAQIPVSRCHTGAGGSLQRESFAATSHVVLDPLDSGGITDLLDHVEDAQTTTGVLEAGISMDALGGTAGRPAPGDTAFVHRQALMTVQYTATFANGSSAQEPTAYVRRFRRTMLKHWGNHAYVNYADHDVKDPLQAYFGENAARLQSVKKTYDPYDFFAQPQGY